MSTEDITPAMQAGYDAQVCTTTLVQDGITICFNLPWDRALHLAAEYAQRGAVTATQPAHGPFPARTLTVG